MLPTAIKAALDKMSSEWNHSMKQGHFMKAQTVMSGARDEQHFRAIRPQHKGYI